LGNALINIGYLLSDSERIVETLWEMSKYCYSFLGWLKMKNPPEEAASPKGIERSLSPHISSIFQIFIQTHISATVPLMPVFFLHNFFISHAF
jgi:hypothetical protein